MAKKTIDLAALQKAVNELESQNGPYKTQDALFAAIATTKWATKAKVAKSAIYLAVRASLDGPTPITMKTKPARVRKGGMSERMTDTPSPALLLRVEPEEETSPVKLSFAPAPRKAGESIEEENGRLRKEVEHLRLKFSVYYREDNEIFDVNPHSVVKCPGNGRATKNKTCPEADAPYSEMIDGMVAAQKVVAEYRTYAESHALNPDDKRRVKEATDVLQAFFSATAISKVELTKRIA